jgi:hypothetical protein
MMICCVLYVLCINNIFFAVCVFREQQAVLCICYLLPIYDALCMYLCRKQQAVLCVFYVLPIFICCVYFVFKELQAVFCMC